MIKKILPQNIQTLNKSYPLLIIACIAANGTALFSDILGPDATLYAYISKQIASTNDFVNLYGNGFDWLDKPHVPFWLAAISFKIFGINAFAYKLPNFLAFLGTIYFLYATSYQFFHKTIAQISTLIFACSFHIILCNFDVRAEIYLTFFILASTYYLLKNLNTNKFIYIVVAAFFAALAVMTKGIFVLITIGSGFVTYWIFAKKWREFIKTKWYLFVFLIIVFITPELYCLYTQFDLHPEKVIFGQKGVSGIKFFFWDSQFGRFFNNGPITGESEKLFFFHTLLWAFLPWSIVLYTAAIVFFRRNITTKFKVDNPYLFVLNSTAITTFILFNISKFQLPHYIVIVFPHFSVLCAKYLLDIKQIKILKVFNWVHIFTFLIVLVFTVIMSYLLNMKGWQLIPISTIILSAVFYLNTKQINPFTIVINGIYLMIFVSVFFNLVYFPSLMKYQGGMMAGKYQKKYLPNSKAYMFNCNDYNFEFYGNVNMQRIEYPKSILKTISQKELLFGPKKSIDLINKDSFSVKPIGYFAEFHISEIKANFINPSTRASSLDSFCLAYCIRLK